MTGIRKLSRFAAVISAGLLTACAGTPPPPDWKMNAQSSLESFEKHYLEGNRRLAEHNYEMARAEIARTGRPDLLARAELIRCATEMAALDPAHCAVITSLPAGTSPEDRAYAAFLAGNWQGLEAASLPEPYRPLLKTTEDKARDQALGGIQSPLSRLIAASVLFRQGNLSPTGIALAMDSASGQGWRRPLLAWLNVQMKRAEAAGDRDALAQLQRRIELVHTSLPPSAK
jgi:hypothetical protein